MSMGPWDGPKADALDLATQGDLRSAALKYTYSTNTANSDPGSGTLKLDNTTLASATILRISETDGDGAGVAALLSTWDDSTSTICGFVTLRKAVSPANFRVYSISGSITDSGAWDSFAVSHVAGNGSFSNGDTLSVDFSRVGDAGATGSAGVDLTDQWQLFAETTTNQWGLDAPVNFGYCFTDSGLLAANGFFGIANRLWWVRIASANFKSVAGKTVKLRTKLQTFTNATDPNVSISWDLRALTSAGGADNMVPAVGSSVSGSGGTQTNANLAASDTEETVSSSFSLPSDGFYCFLLFPSTTVANNAAMFTRARIEYRWE